MPPKASFRKFARAGYTSRGVVYLIIGLFALLAAFGASENKNTKGALEQLLAQPLGTALVILMVIGLLGYVAWRLIQGIFDTDEHGVSLKGLGVRLGLLASAFTYATLAIFALSLLGLFSGGSQQGSAATAISAFIGSKWVALILALIFAGIGGAHWWKAIRQKYARHFDASKNAMRLIHPISMIGLMSRGAVFFIFSFLLTYRGMSAGSDGQPPDIKDALQFLLELPFGRALLAAAGLGIILFAVYSFCEAIWRKINIEDI